MKKQNDPTTNLVLLEIEKLTRQMEADQIRLATLKSLLPQGVSNQKPQEKPQGFVLIASIMKVLEAHRGQSVSLDDIFSEVVRNAGGYTPNKKSVAINLSVWTKNGTITKNSTGYKLA